MVERCAKASGIAARQAPLVAHVDLIARVADHA
jgi:hypothetical protein